MSNNKKQLTADSPEYNKKSKRTFIIILIIATIAGGLGGFLGGIAEDEFTEQFKNIGKYLAKILPTIQAQVMPWVLFLFALVCFILGKVFLKKGKQQIETWDGEDEDHISLADSYLSKAATTSNLLLIGSQVIFAFTTYRLSNVFESANKKTFLIMFLFVIIVYFASMFIAISQSKRTVDFTKKYAPEKKGSIYDTKFHKVWYDSCDEAERHLIGEVSYQTYMFMNKVFSTTLTITGVVGMFIPIGILCAFFVGLLWLLMSCYYSYITAKLEQKNR